MNRATCPVHGKEYISIGYGVIACPVERCFHGTTVTAIEDAQDKEKRKPIKEKVLEADLQLEVITCLMSRHYEVMETGKSRSGVECERCHHKTYATGWQGNTEGLPDLLIRNPQWPRGVWLLVELKGSSTPVSPAQQALCDRGGSYICWSWEEVWAAVQATEEAILEARLEKVGAAKVARLRREHGMLDHPDLEKEGGIE